MGGSLCLWKENVWACTNTETFVLTEAECHTLNQADGSNSRRKDGQETRARFVRVKWSTVLPVYHYEWRWKPEGKGWRRTVVRLRDDVQQSGHAWQRDIGEQSGRFPALSAGDSHDYCEVCAFSLKVDATTVIMIWSAELSDSFLLRFCFGLYVLMMRWWWKYLWPHADCASECLWPHADCASECLWPCADCASECLWHCADCASECLWPCADCTSEF